MLCRISCRPWTKLSRFLIFFLKPCFGFEIDGGGGHHLASETRPWIDCWTGAERCLSVFWGTGLRSWSLFYPFPFVELYNDNTILSYKSHLRSSFHLRGITLCRFYCDYCSVSHFEEHPQRVRSEHGRVLLYSPRDIHPWSFQVSKERRGTNNSELHRKAKQSIPSIPNPSLADGVSVVASSIAIYGCTHQL